MDQPQSLVNIAQRRQFSRATRLTLPLFAEFKELSSKLKEKGLCKRTLHKDMYLSSRALAGDAAAHAF